MARLKIHGGLAINGFNPPQYDETFFIVQEWQTTKPIKIKDGLFISHKDDLISHEDISKMIIETLKETHPEIVLKNGMLGTDLHRFHQYIPAFLCKDQ